MSKYHYPIIKELEFRTNQIEQYIQARINYYEYSSQQHEEHNNMEIAVAEWKFKQELENLLDRMKGDLL